MIRFSAGFVYTERTIRSPVLYPAELWARSRFSAISASLRQSVGQSKSGTRRKRAAHRGTLSSQRWAHTARLKVAAFMPGLTNDPDVEDQMADCFPIELLPFLEGKIGELRLMRFWSKVDMRGPDECWEWQGGRNTNGYGRFKLASYRSVTASRLALIATKKQEPRGMMVLHHCDNPPCCNPHHLYFGTAEDNMRDVVKRNRREPRDQTGANNGAAKLTEEQIELVVQRLQDGWNNKQIAEDLPVSHSMISLIRLGKMWRPTTEALGWEPERRRA